jgi:hypothetical protein
LSFTTGGPAGSFFLGFSLPFLCALTDQPEVDELPTGVRQVSSSKINMASFFISSPCNTAKSTPTAVINSPGYLGLRFTLSFIRPADLSRRRHGARRTHANQHNIDHTIAKPSFHHSCRRPSEPPTAT